MTALTLGDCEYLGWGVLVAEQNEMETIFVKNENRK